MWFLDCPYQFCDIPQYHYSLQWDLLTCKCRAPCVQDGRLTLLPEFPWISILFLLVYWSSLFLEISNSITFSSRESTLDFNFKFSALKASIIESFTLIKLFVTMSLMLALIFPLDSPRSLSNFSFKLLDKSDSWVLNHEVPASFHQV